METLLVRLLKYLEMKADLGEVCPKNSEIAKDLRTTATTVSKHFAMLDDLNRIRREKVGSSRIVHLIGKGKATADPRPPEEPTGPVFVKPRVCEIVRAASDVFDVPLKDILSPSRFREHTHARFAVAYVASKRGWGVCDIGRGLERDHATARHAIGRAECLVASDEDFDMKAAALLRRSPLQEVTL